jgi:carboxylesterase family protein
MCSAPQGSASELYDGDFFSNRTNVILVVMNYRLGSLGFLSTAGGACCELLVGITSYCAVKLTV